jgi:hypothetical protein
MPDPGTDPLSQQAHDLIKSADYHRLTVPDPAAPDATRILRDISPPALLTVPVKSPANAWAMLAALWLWHDALDRCHEIVQQSALNLSRMGRSAQLPQSVQPSPESNGHLAETDKSLSFLHAITHRREADFGNSKYWYARCRTHPVLRSMLPFANDILHPLPADKSLLRLTRDGWDPDAFVDLAEQLHDRPSDPRYGVAVALQKLEWRLLFGHCVRAASGQ